jgi:hypothetical protein
MFCGEHLKRAGNIHIDGRTRLFYCRLVWLLYPLFYQQVLPVTKRYERLRERQGGVIIAWGWGGGWGFEPKPDESKKAWASSNLFTLRSVGKLAGPGPGPLAGRGETEAFYDLSAKTWSCAKCS